MVYYSQHIVPCLVSNFLHYLAHISFTFSVNLPNGDNTAIVSPWLMRQKHQWRWGLSDKPAREETLSQMQNVSSWTPKCFKLGNSNVYKPSKSHMEYNVRKWKLQQISNTGVPSSCRGANKTCLLSLRVIKKMKQTFSFLPLLSYT